MPAASVAAAGWRPVLAVRNERRAERWHGGACRHMVDCGYPRLVRPSVRGGIWPSDQRRPARWPRRSDISRVRRYAAGRDRERQGRCAARRPPVLGTADKVTVQTDRAAARTEAELGSGGAGYGRTICLYIDDRAPLAFRVFRSIVTVDEARLWRICSSALRGYI